MYLSGRARHNHHTYSPSFISPSGEYFEMVRALMDGWYPAWADHFVCLCTTCKVRAERAPLSIKYFNSLPAVRSPVHTCSCVRDRLIGPDAQIRRWSLDFLTAADQMASNGLFLGTKYDRGSSAASREFFALGVV